MPALRLVELQAFEPQTIVRSFSNSRNGRHRRLYQLNFSSLFAGKDSRLLNYYLDRFYITRKSCLFAFVSARSPNAFADKRHVSSAHGCNPARLSQSARVRAEKTCARLRENARTPEMKRAGVPDKTRACFIRISKSARKQPEMLFNVNFDRFFIELRNY